MAKHASTLMSIDRTIEERRAKWEKRNEKSEQNNTLQLASTIPNDVCVKSI